MFDHERRALRYAAGLSEHRGLRQRKSEMVLDMANKKRNTACDLRGGPCLRHSPQYPPQQLLRCLSFLNALNIAQTTGPQSLPSFAMARVANCRGAFRRIALRRNIKRLA